MAGEWYILSTKEDTLRVPQGSILGSLLLLIYTNDLSNCLEHAAPRLFVDDSSITVAGKSVHEIEVLLNHDLVCIKNGGQQISWILTQQNWTYCYWIQTKDQCSSRTTTHSHKEWSCWTSSQQPWKFLVYISMNLLQTWEKHIDEITKKISYAMDAIRKLKDFADRETLVFIYNALAQPDFDYCCEVWDSPGDSLARRLQRLQNRCARVIMNSSNDTGQSEIAMQALGWISRAEQRAKNKAKVMFKICFKKLKFFMAWHRLHYQISLQTPT